LVRPVTVAEVAVEVGVVNSVYAPPDEYQIV